MNFKSKHKLHVILLRNKKKSQCFSLHPLKFHWFVFKSEVFIQYTNSLINIGSNLKCVICNLGWSNFPWLTFWRDKQLIF